MYATCVLLSLGHLNVSTTQGGDKLSSPPALASSNRSPNKLTTRSNNNNNYNNNNGGGIRDGNGRIIFVSDLLTPGQLGGGGAVQVKSS
jgi:hypothetical protein